MKRRIAAGLAGFLLATVLIAGCKLWQQRDREECYQAAAIWPWRTNLIERCR